MTAPALHHADVSIIIPVFNVGEWVIEALESVVQQELQPLEVIVVDDGSTDGADRRITPYLVDPKVRMIRTENRGLAAARNRGIAEARGTFVALLDADDRYRPQYLSRMMARATAADQPSFVTCDAISFGSPKLAGERFSDRYAQADPITLLRFLDEEASIFGLSVIRRADLQRIGGYDERLRSAEDLDLWLRLLATGATGALVPEILVEYRRHGGSLSSKTAQLMHDSATAFAKLAASLPDGREQEIARRRHADAAAKEMFNMGIDDVLAGDTHAGIHKMRASGMVPDNLKWRLAMPAMTLVPALAPILLRYYRGSEA